MLFKRRREINREKEKRVTEIILKKKKTMGTKLLTNNKKLKLKIQSRVWNFKNIMLKKRGKTKTNKQKKTRSKKL